MHQAGQGARQGLTLVHFSAQPEPFPTQNTLFRPPNTFCHLLTTRKRTPKQSLNAPRIPQKALRLSRKVDKCKPLARGLCSEHDAGAKRCIEEDCEVGRCRLTL